MLTREQIEHHAKAISTAFEEGDLRKAMEALYTFGKLIQENFETSRYEDIGKMFKGAMGEYVLPQMFSDDVLKGCAEVVDEATAYYSKHFEEDQDRQKKGDFSIAKTVPAFKIGVLCFTMLVDSVKLQEGFKRIATDLGIGHRPIISACISSKVEQEQERLALKKMDRLKSACKEAKEILDKEMSQLSKHRPNEEMNTVTKQYLILEQLRGILENKSEATAVQKIKAYKTLLENRETKPILQASSKGKTIRAILSNFVHAVKVSGLSVFKQNKEKTRALRAVQMIEEPVARSSGRFRWKKR